jgi:2-furoyl-CoA dehydrogenase large subunit
MTGMPSRATLVGKPVLRLEDPALLRGRARFVDDLSVKPGTLHAAILRSPHAHAEIASVDAGKALQMPGVAGVVTRAQVLALTDPFLIGLTTPLEYRCLATDRVRFVGEPVALVLASDRYLAEDALDAISVDYRPLPAVIDPVAAAAPTAPVLHPKIGSNIIVTRDFVHGDVAGAFARAPHKAELTVHFPRNSIPPMEGFAVIAEYLGEEDGYDTVSNFQGPLSLHTVMARALRVPSNRLRVRTAPNSGGAFGVKLVLYVPIVLMCVAARIAGRPVKWIEDRLEHLAAANSMANRTSRVEAAYCDDGEVLALRYHHWDDHGAYLRAPMPAPTIRAHSFCTGAYAIPAVQETIDVVATNKTPTGAVRGFGAPQIHFALERIMHRIAVELGKDPLDVMRRNLIPASAFPYQAPGGGLYDSGNYQAAVEEAIERGGLEELRRRREAARGEGRLYGIATPL